MRIAFCLGGLNKGGAERVVSNLANYMAKDNEIIIIITKLDKIEYELDEKVKVFVLDNNSNNKINIIRNIKILIKMKKILINNNTDVAIAFLQEPIARLLFLKKFNRKIRKIKTIISMRIDPNHAFNSFKNRLSLSLYNMADGIVFQTEEAKQFFNKRIQKKGIIIPNAINPIFYDLRKKTKRKNVLVSVGRLTKQKNYPMLINAFSIVSKRYKDYTLEIFGDGVLKQELQNLIDSLDLKNKILLRGNVKNIKDEIYNARLFILSSDYEGLSNALMESLALGIPTISTDSDGGGAKMLIKDGINGILVPKDDYRYLATKISDLLDDENLSNKLSMNAIESMKKYNPKKINKEWSNYINDVIGKK